MKDFEAIVEVKENSWKLPNTMYLVFSEPFNNTKANVDKKNVPEYPLRTFRNKQSKTLTDNNTNNEKTDHF